MSSTAPSLSPTQVSSASVATTASSPTNQASTASPPAPSTASSVSSPQFPPPAAAGPAHPPGPQAAPHHAAVSGPSTGAPAGARSSSSSQPHLQPTLPSPSTQRQIAEARNALVASIGNMLDGELQSRAAILHSNMGAIEKQQRDVERAMAALRKENDKLEKVANDAARRAKEVGDVQNWAEILEKDFLQLEETLRLVREGTGSGSDEGSWSDSGSWSGSDAGTEIGEREGEEEIDSGIAREGECRLDEEIVRDAEGDVSMDVLDVSIVQAKADKGKAREVIERMEVDEVPSGPSRESQSITEVESNVTTDEAPDGSEAASASASSALKEEPERMEVDEVQGSRPVESQGIPEDRSSQATDEPAKNSGPSPCDGTMEGESTVTA